MQTENNIGERARARRTGTVSAAHAEAVHGGMVGEAEAVGSWMVSRAESRLQGGAVDVGRRGTDVEVSWVSGKGVAGIAVCTTMATHGEAAGGLWDVGRGTWEVGLGVRAGLPGMVVPASWSGGGFVSGLERALTAVEVCGWLMASAVVGRRVVFGQGRGGVAGQVDLEIVYKVASLGRLASGERDRGRHDGAGAL